MTIKSLASMQWLSQLAFLFLVLVGASREVAAGPREDLLATPYRLSPFQSTRWIEEAERLACEKGIEVVAIAVTPRQVFVHASGELRQTLLKHLSANRRADALADLEIPGSIIYARDGREQADQPTWAVIYAPQPKSEGDRLGHLLTLWLDAGDPTSRFGRGR